MKNLINFKSEAECILFFKSFREEMGIVCKSCMGKKHYWIQSKKQWQCSKCRFRTTLKSGTALQHSNIKLSFWLQAMELYAEEGKGLSAKALQKKLNMKRYEPVWAMLHKMRKYMGQWTRNVHCPNSGYIHQGKVLTKCSESTQKETGIVARTQTVLMIHGIQTLEDSKIIRTLKTGLRLYIVNRLEVPPVNKYLLEKWNNRISFKYPQGYKTKFRESRLNIELNEVKERIVRVHCMVSENYLSNYLNDYCFRRNFRSTVDQLFNRLLETVSFPWWSIY